MRFKFVKKEDFEKIPQTSGVYCFQNENKILYIGKSANLKERIKNHFQQQSWKDNLFLNKVKKIGFFPTDSEIEALILESNLIKKYQPQFNVLWKDDKNYFFVGICQEKFPYVFLSHQTKKLKTKKAEFFGPFVDGKALKKTLKILRKIFPYYTTQKHPPKPCSWCHLGYCPGPNPDEKNYQKNIKNLIDFLKGKKDFILKRLRKEMEILAQKEDFEGAIKIRDQLFSLQRIISHAKILSPERKENWENIEENLRKILKSKKRILRLEAFDISNIQGKLATGSMVVFIEGKEAKNFYRKFKIKTEGKPNDLAMLKEILVRRFSHDQWPFPDLILIDGGKAQLNLAIKVKNEKLKTKKIKVISLAKRKGEIFFENKQEPLLVKNLPKDLANFILRVNKEAHRFAISYHRKLMKKSVLI